MDNDKGWQDTLGSVQEKTNNTYTTEYLNESIRRAIELFDIMLNQCGYSEKQVFEMFVGHKKLGNKERVLYSAMLRGDVSPTDSLATIKKKLDDEMELSRQSWSVAFNNLILAGKLTNG